MWGFSNLADGGELWCFDGKEFGDMTVSRQKKKRKKLLSSSLSILEVDVRSDWRGDQDLACDDFRQVHNAEYYARITPVGHCRNVQRQC